MTKSKHFTITESTVLVILDGKSYAGRLTLSGKSLYGRVIHLKLKNHRDGDEREVKIHL